jgi:hypothetical protein
MIKVCQWCEKEFDSHIRNQIYCSSDCRTNSTKQKISQRYQQSKFRTRLKKERRCAGGCNTLLSVYNDSKFCDSCLVNNKQVDKLMKEIKGYFDYEKK